MPDTSRVRATLQTLLADNIAGDISAQDVRDMLVSVYPAWTTWTPTWTARSTDPVIGNGAIRGRYIQMGTLIIGEATIAMGSTTTYGSGAWELSLPVDPSETQDWMSLGGAICQETGVQGNPGNVGWRESLGTIDIVSHDGVNGGQIAAGFPFTWGDTDILSLHVVYEVADGAST